MQHRFTTGPGGAKTWVCKHDGVLLIAVFNSIPKQVLFEGHCRTIQVIEDVLRSRYHLSYQYLSSIEVRDFIG